MKTYITIILVLLCSGTTVAQNEYVGVWNGDIMGMPLVFKIEMNNGAPSASMQSPKQSKIFMPASSTTMVNDSISIEISSYQIKYVGMFDNDRIRGRFRQGTATFDLILNPGEYDPNQSRKPQEPLGKLPYQSQEVFFNNPADPSVTLAATLTMPANVKRPPVAIMISGSGPQNRDEELMGHRPFLVWSDYLTRNGIAVLRYDDRGTAASTGNYDSATSADLATDVVAAVEFLETRKDIDNKKIGLIGHSEGGMIAPMVITQVPDKISFFVSLAGPGVSGYDALLPQLKKLSVLNGMSEEMAASEQLILQPMLKEVRDSGTVDKVILQKRLVKNMMDNREKLPAYLQDLYSEQQIRTLASQFSSDWMRFFIQHDPAPDLQKIKVPTLLLNGSLDYQIIPEINLYKMQEEIKKSGNEDVIAIEYGGLNHLFQKAVTGAASEYATIQETVNPAVLKDVADWINRRF